MPLIGRASETKLMQSYLKDRKAHLVAIIGRRRVGKTFLIREVYKKNIVFEMTGLKDADLKTQLVNFKLQFEEYFQLQDVDYSSWLIAFHQLSKAIEARKTKKKKVVFFDELPWMASKRSGFTEALAHWWNNWACQQNIIVVICGSAASWMLENIVYAKGGLHNRITKLIALQPFTLSETKLFLASKQIRLSHYQIIQLYMTMGGIPHYLEQVQKGKSAAQNIQELCFAPHGVLRNEFENLYVALFDNAENHIKIIKALAKKAKGMERTEILKLTRISDGGGFTKTLKELEASGFISTVQPLEKKKKGTLYRLTDEYSLFYLKFMEGKQIKKWLATHQQQDYKIWCGYAFENLCMKHVDDVLNALGIEGIQSHVNSFLHRADDDYPKGFQIDLLIDRKDEVINLCEMKFYADEFVINKEYAKKLRTKREGLKAVLKTKKTIHITFISVYGVFENQNKLDLIENDLNIEIFFKN